MSQAKRIEAAMRHKGITRTDLARACGVSKAAVGQWINQDTKAPKAENIFKIAAATGVSAQWLATGKGEMLPAGSAAASHSNVALTSQPSRYHSYPVISCVQAGGWAEAIAPYEPGAEPHHEGTDYRAQGSAFWLEVKGDSMTAPHGASPSITEGTLVLFDTGLEAAPGKLVVAQLEGANEATFKQLIEDGGQRYLKALNPAYPLIPVNGNCRILGVAVETKMRL